ncbi:MAG: universal stress protein [Anaerolineae bacterium]|nr:universal stress protein [Anaerolineae bacterium]
MGYQKILVTLDGSGLAELALQAVPEVADFGAEVHILSVIDHPVTVETVGEMASLYTAMNSAVMIPGPQYPIYKSVSIPQSVTIRTEYLEEVGGWLKERGYQVSFDARPGEVVDTIVDMARNYDLLIMATHGRTGLRRVLLGSVAEAVLHKAPCPVLLVPVRE